MRVQLLPLTPAPPCVEQPIATALFANSPFVDGKPSGFKSFRSNVWCVDVSPRLQSHRTSSPASRHRLACAHAGRTWTKRAQGTCRLCSSLALALRGAAAHIRGALRRTPKHRSATPACSYVEYVLDVPMYFVYRDGKYIDASGQSFRDFLAGRLPALPGQQPTMLDWENHLTTVFPEVRLKRFLEMRGADNGPWRSICSLPALWVRHAARPACMPNMLTPPCRACQVGLLYDAQAQSEAAALIADWTQQERATLRAQVPRLALDTPFRGEKVQQVAQRVVAIAKVRSGSAVVKRVRALTCRSPLARAAWSGEV